MLLMIVKKKEKTHLTKLSPMLLTGSLCTGDLLSCDGPVEICEIADMADIRFFAR